MSPNPYQQQAIATASPAQLVLMLYDGVLAAIARAEKAQGEGLAGLATVNHELQRAQDIITELLVTLDRERGGAVALSLVRLYDFSLDRLIRANVSKNLELIKPVVEVMQNLRDAWEAACCRQVAATG
jgi:flagellar protein FliS